LWSIVGKKYGRVFKGLAGMKEERYVVYHEFCCQHDNKEEAQEFLEDLTSEEYVWWEGEFFEPHEVFLTKDWPFRDTLYYNFNLGKFRKE